MHTFAYYLRKIKTSIGLIAFTFTPRVRALFTYIPSPQNWYFFTPWKNENEKSLLDTPIMAFSEKPAHPWGDGRGRKTDNWFPYGFGY